MSSEDVEGSVFENIVTQVTDTSSSSEDDTALLSQQKLTGHFVRGGVIAPSHSLPKSYIDAFANASSSDEDEGKNPVGATKEAEEGIAEEPPETKWYEALQDRVAERQREEQGVSSSTANVAYERLYGKGFAMLKRMGFRGDMQTVKAPLQLKPRKTRRGLQESGERPKEQGPLVEFDPVSLLLGDRPKKQPQAKNRQQRNRWKKSGPKADQPSIHVYSAEVIAGLKERRLQMEQPVDEISEIDSEEDVREHIAARRRRRNLMRQMQKAQDTLHSKSQPLRIVDMTEQETKIITSTNTLASKLAHARRVSVPTEEGRTVWDSPPADSTGDIPEPLQDTRAALRRAIAEADDELATAARRRAAAEDRLERWQQKEAGQDRALKESETTLKTIRPVITAVSRWINGPGMANVLPAMLGEEVAQPPMPPPDALLLEAETIFEELLQEEPEGYLAHDLPNLLIIFMQLIVDYAERMNAEGKGKWEILSLVPALVQVREACLMSLPAASFTHNWEAFIEDTIVRGIKETLSNIQIAEKPPAEFSLVGQFADTVTSAVVSDLFAQFFFPRFMEKVEILLAEKAARKVADLMESWMAVTPSKFQTGFLCAAIRSAHWMGC